MRKALPQLVLVGQPDLAFQIFNGFKVTSSEEVDVSNHGTFLARALAASDVAPEKCAEYIIQ